MVSKCVRHRCVLMQQTNCNSDQLSECCHVWNQYRMAVSGGLADALLVEVLYCQLQVLMAFLNTCCSSCWRLRLTRRWGQRTWRCCGSWCTKCGTLRQSSPPSPSPAMPPSRSRTCTRTRRRTPRSGRCAQHRVKALTFLVCVCVGGGGGGGLFLSSLGFVWKCLLIFMFVVVVVVAY